MRGTLVRSLVYFLLVVPFALACADKKRLGRPGDFCFEDADCGSGLCYEGKCLDPDGDEDGDGLRNGEERNLSLTNPLLADTDGDGDGDAEEVGDPAQPKDADGDGENDGIESSSPAADPDADCLPDQFDPNDDTPDANQGQKLVELFCDLRQRGVCAAGESRIVATCDTGAAVRCDYSGVPDYEADETRCDGRDNDCDGDTDDEDTVRTPPASLKCDLPGVCGEPGAPIEKRCGDGEWRCVYSAVEGYEEVETLCDGRDNDCDGDTDETLAGEPCTRENEFGACSGTTACTADGGVECSAPDASPEVCDSIDNDCDGGTDEDDVCMKTARIFGRVQHFGARPGIEGATIEAWPEEACESLTSEAGPTGTPGGVATSGAEGAYAVPVKPGIYCLRALAEGFQQAVSWSVNVPEQGTFGVDFALTPVGSTGYGLEVCGQTVDAATSLPVDGAHVALHHVETGAEHAATTSDEDGLFCLPAVAADALGWGGDLVFFKVAAVRQGYRILTMPSIGVAVNSVPVLILAMEPVPTVVTTCLADDFEPCQGPACPSFTPDPPVQGVGWRKVTSSVAAERVNMGIGLCVDPTKDEQCNPGAAGCALCGDSTMPGCIPAPGALPNPPSGFTHWWFGNPEFGNYLGFDGKCSEVKDGGGGGKPVSGGLVSPLIDATQAVSLRLAFKTAWEIEGKGPEWADRMTVDVQEDGTEDWVTVLTLNPTAPVGGSFPVGFSSGGLGLAPVYTHAEADLSKFAGKRIRFRFFFDSIDGDCNAFRGWLVDQVELTGAGCLPFASPGA